MLTLLIEVGKVPLGESITKRTGSKQYFVQSAITIYGGDKQEIEASDDCRFLLDPEAPWRVNTIAAETKVLWTVTAEDLVYMINNGEV